MAFAGDARITGELIASIRAVTSGEGGALMKWNVVLKLLQEARLPYQLDDIGVEQFLVHPDNRGGMGINAHDAHETLATVFKVGADPEHLVKATAFEICPQHEEKSKQIFFNQELIRLSGGLLAPMNGNERYITVACSHFTQALRAAKAKCITHQTSLKDSEGRLSCEKLLLNDLTGHMTKIINKGWRWTIVPWQVAAAMPELPSLAQAALNADHATYSMASELEVACAMGKGVQIHGDWTLAERHAKAAMPPCHEYIGVIAKFANLYGGGDGVPMIRCTRLDSIASICLLYNFAAPTAASTRSNSFSTHQLQVAQLTADQLQPQLWHTALAHSFSSAALQLTADQFRFSPQLINSSPPLWFTAQQLQPVHS